MAGFRTPACSAQALPPASPAAALLTLEEAERLALEHNQALRAQRLNIDQSKPENPDCLPFRQALE